ncbi:MAG TPA: YcaO-like family protein, partial [Longimicrobiaceae bacterium]|nr:YcaO-like family protein [Longimicrobiaceae bacterium]
IDSNGLASGNHILEAAAAGLYETIERDALTCHLLAEFRTPHRMPRVKLDTIENPLVRDVLDRLRAAHVTPLLYDCTVDTGVPTYMSYIYDDENRHVGVAGGAGTHLDPAIAMIRALTESVQTRVVYISGSRDDIFRHDSHQFKAKDSLAWLERLESVPETADARDRVSESTSTFQGDVAAVIAKLEAVGLREVYMLDLTQEEIGVPVVRIWVPGLEGFASNLYTAGPRATAFCRSVSEPC